MSTPDWTIGRLLTWTTDYLKQHGSESPRLDAEVLLAHVRNCPRIMLYTAFTEPAPESLRTAFRELVKRRADGAPVAYLVGRKEFYSLPFTVTPDVLIPRPETEHLVMRALDLIKGWGNGPVRVCDIGTGSGIVAVTIARHAPNAEVIAVDISPAALAIAAKNAHEHGVSDRVQFVESDLLAKVEAAEPFDLIVSNPPYIGSAEMGSLAAGVREFEPRLALEAGPQGTEVIERLIPQAAAALRDGGWLLVEISPIIHGAVEKLLAAESRFRPASTIKDMAGHLRIVQAQRV